MVRAVERALDKNLDRPYTHLVSLDFTNAFNTVDRTAIASSLKELAPKLWRITQWAYGRPSTLAIGDSILTSSQGVRQGDPLDHFWIASRTTWAGTGYSYPTSTISTSSPPMIPP